MAAPMPSQTYVSSDAFVAAGGAWRWMWQRRLPTCMGRRESCTQTSSGWEEHGAMGRRAGGLVRQACLLPHQPFSYCTKHALCPSIGWLLPPGVQT